MEQNINELVNQRSKWPCSMAFCMLRVSHSHLNEFHLQTASITPGQATREVQLNLQLANLEDPDGGIFLTPRKPR